MEKNAAINLAIDGLRHIIKEKLTTAYFPDKREKMIERMKQYDEAIEVLEGLKDATET